MFVALTVKAATQRLQILGTFGQQLTEQTPQPGACWLEIVQ
jgi:hypothetical protein